MKTQISRTHYTLLCLAMIASTAGCASDPSRIADTQVRSADRPECQLSAARGKEEGVSGTETRFDPCGTSGTFPIITNEDLDGSNDDDD